MSNNPNISIVLGTYNRLNFLKLTINSIREEIKNISSEIIIIDGGSTDGTIKWLTKQKDIISIIQHNRGEWRGKKIERRSWGYFMNLGFKCAQGKYVCMLSDDCLLVPGTIVNGFNLFEEKLNQGEKVGAVAFYWRNWPEQEKYFVGLTLGNKVTVNHGLYLRTALEEVNFIDETFHFYYADGDLCLKLWQKGYICIDSPNSYVEHYSHANMSVRNSNYEREQDDWSNFLKKWNYSCDDGNLGSFIGKIFLDPNNTANHFKKFYDIKIISKYTDIKRYVNYLKKLLTRGYHFVIPFPKYIVYKTAKIKYKKLVRIKAHAEIKDYVIIQTFKKPVLIGEYTQINPFTVIYGSCGVNIGDNVMIAPHCMIASGNHDFKQTQKPMRFADSITKGPIIIEDNVWIGANCTITDGVRIGHDAVVAANSVVTKDVAPFDIVAGTPARIIKNRLQNNKNNKIE